MADSSNRPKAEHVRSNYRKHLFKKRELSKSEDGEGLAFTAPTIVDKIAGDADGLMPIGKIGAPLNVEIPVWPDRPDPGLPFTNVLYLDWRPVTVPASEYQSFHNEEVPDSGTLPDDEFPLERTIPLSVFANFEGKFEFRYRVKNWNSPVETDSDPSPVTIDRTGPLRPDVPDSIIVEKPLITTAVLEADGGVKCEVPDFDEDKKEFVTIAVAWLDEPPTGELDPVELAFLGLLPADRKILVPKDLVYKLGSKFHYVVYFLFDKAGNRSDMPYPVRVQVALGDLPDGLQAPEVPLADDDLIDRADAASPTTVRIQEYDNWTSEDGILIKWGLNKIKRTPVGTHLPFPLDITVPWSHLKDEYDFVKGGVQLKDVDYEVLRGDYGLQRVQCLLFTRSHSLFDRGPGQCARNRSGVDHQFYISRIQALVTSTVLHPILHESRTIGRAVAACLIKPNIGQSHFSGVNGLLSCVESPLGYSSSQGDWGGCQLMSTMNCTSVEATPAVTAAAVDR